MTVLDTYQFPDTGQSVRTVLVDGDPWFVARDVCTALGISNSRDAVSRVHEDGVGTTDVIDSMGRKQKTSIVNEPGLYELIFQSRRPEATAFRRWVTHEVLPQIRRTGTYGTPAPAFDPASLTRADILRMALESEQERLALEARAGGRMGRPSSPAPPKSSPPVSPASVTCTCGSTRSR